jgi:serine/threonine protein kinase
MPAKVTQQCPNCHAQHDVGVYVTGQKVRCKCGIPFQVRRTDVSMVGSANPPPRPNPTFVPRAGGAALKPVPNELVAEDAFPQEAPDTRANVDRTFISTAIQIVIPGYELKEILGKGGMGEVWRAVQQSLGRLVAVKILPPKLAQDSEFIRRFEKEATALATLQHPNVIQIIDRGVAGEHYYFVMEYVQGRSLRELINEGPVEPGRALKIIQEVCAAIDYAHDQQIIHRDLKPENILLDERGHVKVADFGLAGMKGTDERLQMTATAVAMGTINYMAPEQRRDAKNVDGRADLFSLGVMLYELLTGELPVGRFEIPSAKVPGLDPRIDDIVEKALAQDPTARYERASIIGRELDDILATLGTTPVLGVVSGKQKATVLGRAGRPQVSGENRPSLIQSGWNGLRLGLLIVGAIAVVGAGIKVFSSQTTAKDLLLEANIVGEPKDPPAYPPNTDDEVFSSVTANASGSDMWLTFDEGNEELNAHSGTWKVERGTLKAIQAGNQTNGTKLIPRAYVAHRYFSSDDVTMEAQMRMKSIKDQFRIEDDTQFFSELAFRIKDLQVSILAIPGGAMRLGWRYYTSDGIEQKGNSSQDIEDMVEDEMPTPPEGRPFRVKLTLKRKKNGTEVEAFANNQRFAKKLLVGLEGQVGKVAVGCRNLQCEFDDLKATGKIAARPAPRASAE